MKITEGLVATLSWRMTDSQGELIDENAEGDDFFVGSEQHAADSEGALAGGFDGGVHRPDGGLGGVEGDLLVAAHIHDSQSHIVGRNFRRGRCTGVAVLPGALVHVTFVVAVGDGWNRHVYSIAAETEIDLKSGGPSADFSKGVPWPNA